MQHFLSRRRTGDGSLIEAFRSAPKRRVTVARPDELRTLFDRVRLSHGLGGGRSLAAVAEDDEPPRSPGLPKHRRVAARRSRRPFFAVLGRIEEEEREYFCL